MTYSRSKQGFEVASDTFIDFLESKGYSSKTKLFSDYTELSKGDKYIEIPNVPVLPYSTVAEVLQFAGISFETLEDYLD